MYQVDEKKWRAFSREVQTANIATEFSRAARAGLHGEIAGEERREGAYERALALIDASINDPKWQDKTALYELRDATAALYDAPAHPAISRFIAGELVRNATTM